MRRRVALASAIAAVALLVTACRDTPITRKGSPQRLIVSRAFPRGARELRDTILARYTATHDQLSDAFRVLRMTEQPPPGYSRDWIANYVDPGGFFEPYRSLTDSARANDLVLLEPTGDKYWWSEYATADGPVRFHCTLILHFISRSSSETELQVFELVPTVWVGEHWAMAKEGFGPGRFHDIRFVEPTVKDRQDVLDFVDSILK